MERIATMKKLLVMIAVAAFTVVSASADCGKCPGDKEKSKCAESAKCKDKCKAEHKCTDVCKDKCAKKAAKKKAN